MTRLCIPSVEMLSDFLEKKSTHCFTTQRENRARKVEKVYDINVLPACEGSRKTIFDFLSISGIYGRRGKENIVNRSVPGLRNRGFNIR